MSNNSELELALERDLAMKAQIVFELVIASAIKKTLSDLPALIEAVKK